MMGFFLALLAVGGLGSLSAMADPTRAQYFPYTFPTGDFQDFNRELEQTKRS
jgi:hypothetical protein